MEKLKHPKGPYHIFGEGRFDIYTAPHFCADSECPGEVNRRKLEELEKLENRAAMIAYKAGLGASEYESVTHVAAVKVVKAKLQAAEEMARAIKLSFYPIAASFNSALRKQAYEACQAALEAWENAGKDKGE